MGRGGKAKEREKEKDSSQGTFRTFRNVKDSRDYVGDFR